MLLLVNEQKVVIKMWSVILVTLLAVPALSELQHFKICVQDTVTESTCIGLKREDSPLLCERVLDSSECAIKLAEGRADIGIFNAEELLLAHQFYPTNFELYAELRHKDRYDEPIEFQSVAVVPSTYKPSQGGFGHLQGKGLCHPGFSKEQGWNDFILKYFEKKVYDNVCHKEYSLAENEIRNLKEFFGKACRPGEWVLDQKIDAELKKKYPELCSLCSDPSRCTYESEEHHGHIGALECLTSNRGDVAYAALSYVREYFQIDDENTEQRTDYQFLCPNGTVEPLSTKYPCAWIKQPWSSIVVRKDRMEDFIVYLGPAMNALPHHTTEWTKSLHEIISKEGEISIFQQPIFPEEYLSSRIEAQIVKPSCEKTIQWCTVHPTETLKCEWVAKEAKALGISPEISCVETNSTFRCFRRISEGRADIMTIDSHYGYLARKVFNLAPVMYSETDKERNSVVIAVQLANSRHKISSFKDLRQRNACFPEYGGIAWLSFVNTARNHDLISDSCNYAHQAANLLGGACTPGFRDRDHSKNATSHSHAAILCSICPRELYNDTCSANHRNSFYGDKGALECLNSGSGDIAFIESRNLKYDIQNKLVDEHRYRVLCKNGSLALRTGFDVDEHCPLVVTIDSEVVSRRHDKTDTTITDITLALLKLENWLGYRGEPRRPIHIYDPFNRTIDVLFKDSTTGLVSTSSEIKTVLAYKELFNHVDMCSGASSITFRLFVVFLGTIALKHII